MQPYKKNKIFFQLIIIQISFFCFFIHLTVSTAQEKDALDIEFGSTPGLYRIEMDEAPFPFIGKIPHTNEDFFDAKNSQGVVCHRTSNGDCFSEEYYQDSSVYLYHPPLLSNKTKNKLAPLMIYFFHGHHSDLKKDLENMGVLQQVQKLERPLWLVIPQFAKNIADSSPGKFYNENAFKNFHEATLKNIHTLSAVDIKKLKSSPLFFVAYSGGYKALAYSLKDIEKNPSIKGVLLLDAFYGEFEKYQDLHQHHKKWLWLHISGESTQKNYEDFFKLSPLYLNWEENENITFKHSSSYFIKSHLPHDKILNEGPPEHPIYKVLRDFITKTK